MQSLHAAGRCSHQDVQAGTASSNGHRPGLRGGESEMEDTLREDWEDPGPPPVVWRCGHSTEGQVAGLSKREREAKEYVMRAMVCPACHKKGRE